MKVWAAQLLNRNRPKGDFQPEDKTYQVNQYSKNKIGIRRSNNIEGQFGTCFRESLFVQPSDNYVF